MPILTGMYASQLLLWLVCLAQITSGAPLPEDAQVFTIIMKEGQSERVVHAAIMVDGEFVSEFDMSKRSGQVELHFDTPWHPTKPERILSQRLKQVEPEGRIQKEKRYKESGYEQLSTPKGDIWVATADRERAEKANALQASLEAELEANAAAHALQVNASGESSGPGFVQLWGRHIVILVSALVVLIVTVRSCF